MLREQMQSTSRRHLYRRLAVRTRAEALAELRTPCGKFKSPLSTEEKLRSFIAEKAADIEDLSNPLFIDDGTPLNWQRLLRFLHEQGILATPRFGDSLARNDFPHSLRSFQIPSIRNPFSPNETAPMFAGASSFDTNEAMSKAIGETLERHFFASPYSGPLLAASYADLSRRHTAIDIRAFDYFLDWQRKQAACLDWNEHTVFEWVRGQELGTSKKVYIPAHIVYWNYKHGTYDGPTAEKKPFLQTTSGCAGHFTQEAATLAALLEAIQRDAFLIYWLNSLSPKVIDTETIKSPKVQDFVAEVRRFNFDLVFLNTTSDFSIPTATCVMIDKADPENPTYALGSSTGFSAEDIFTSSATEAFSVLQFTSSRDPYVLSEKYEPFTSRTLSRTERLCLWRGKVMAERFRFFLSGEKQSEKEFMGDMGQFDTTGEKLAFIVGECAKRGKGYEIYTYEVTHPVLKTLGYHVVRAIVPALVPLYLVEFAAPLKARRLKEVPERIRYKAAKEFNSWPHPFP